jgi:hypothetical protein
MPSFFAAGILPNIFIAYINHIHDEITGKERMMVMTDGQMLKKQNLDDQPNDENTNCDHFSIEVVIF